MKVALFLSFLSATAALSQNLIPNGDFEAGNTGFLSEYTFSTFGYATYTITTDPHIPYPSSKSFGDHTTGSGSMFTADGATTANVTLWEVSIGVSPNRPYAFSGWTSSWGNLGNYLDPSPARIQLEINGVAIGIADTPEENGQWVQFNFSWDSGTATVADLRMVNLNTAATGNDPCMDDLFFSVIPEPTTLTLLGLGSLALLMARRRK